jgi:nitrogen fixation NifU-like protein
MTDLYREEILDHYYHPRNAGKLDLADLVGHADNPLCGDEVTMYLKFDGEKISDIKFQGSGCAISQASTSMLTEYLKGKSRQEIEKLDFDTVKLLLKVEVGPGRVNCALLPVQALQAPDIKKNGRRLAEHKYVDTDVT